MSYDVFEQAARCVRIPEFASVAHVYGAQEPLQATRVVEHPILVSRYRAYPFAGHACQDASPQRCRRVLAEVVAISEGNSLQQKLHLDVLEVLDVQWC